MKYNVEAYKKRKKKGILKIDYQLLEQMFKIEGAEILNIHFNPMSESIDFLLAQTTPVDPTLNGKSLGQFNETVEGGLIPLVYPKP